MALPAKREGAGPCPFDGKHEVFFKRSKGGKLGFVCPRCETGVWTDEGSAADAKWMASIKDPPGVEAPIVAPVKRKGFDLADLGGS
jgi:hypothetical protein